MCVVSISVNYPNIEISPTQHAIQELLFTHLYSLPSIINILWLNSLKIAEKKAQKFPYDYQFVKFNSLFLFRIDLVEFIQKIVVFH